MPILSSLIPSRGLVCLLVALLLTGCSGTGSPGPTDGRRATGGATAAERSGAPDATRSFAVVGDSITSGTAAPLRDPDVDAPDSWVPGALGEPLTFVGGWATPGATTKDMRDAVGAQAAGVLVLMAGTNDLGASVPWSDSEDNLEAIVDTVGISDVVVSAVPPLDPMPEQALEYNRRLAELADREGWTYVDPWVQASRNGSFTAGASEDGIHPVPAVAEQAGERLRWVLLEGLDG